MHTGYGEQTALWVPRLIGLGYDVIISAFAGLAGAPLSWNGITVLPCAQDLYGSDVLPAHLHQAKADVVITLMDVWALQADLLKNVPLACWMPVDTVKLGSGDRDFLTATKAIPIAMSRHGERCLSDAGFEPLYVPHGIDTTVFTPRADRDELRERAGLTEKFVIGLNAANKDAIRKGFHEQLEAFAQFHRAHEDAVLLVHSAVSMMNALDLLTLARECGVPDDAITFSHQYKLLMGLYSQPEMVAWYSTLDVLSNTAMAEGFGLAPLEAMACGVPAIVTDTSSMPELVCDECWLVPGQEFWNPTHTTKWVMPSIPEIVKRYELAYELTHSPSVDAMRKQARSKALEYDASRVLESHWRPALAALEERLAARSS